MRAPGRGRACAQAARLPSGIQLESAPRRRSSAASANEADLLPPLQLRPLLCSLGKNASTFARGGQLAGERERRAREARKSLGAGQICSDA